MTRVGSEMLFTRQKRSQKSTKRLLGARPLAMLLYKSMLKSPRSGASFLKFYMASAAVDSDATKSC